MNTGFVKNLIIAGFTGGETFFVIMYILIYARSKGLTVIKVAMMYHQEIQIGGCHRHKLLCVPVDRGNNMSVYQIAELAIQKLKRFPQQN